MTRFNEIADVSFMGNITLAGLKKTALDEYSTAHSEITGKNIPISDEHKAILYAVAQIFYQSAEAIDTKARQNLLKYSSGAYLDNLALGKTTPRKMAECSVVTIRFTLSAVRQNIVAIPQGTRVTNSAQNIYFSTTEYTEIPAGDSYIDVMCISTIGGAAANDFDIGEINILVDPVAYIGTVSNVDVPTGGADEETDEAFAMRIYEARNVYSTTGSESAYIYYTKSYSTAIEDVYPTNPKAAEIEIYILMADRKEATPAFIEGLTDHLYNVNTKPLTDKITVKNVEQIQYNIDVEYTIYETDISKLSEIEKTVAAAVEQYKVWQCAKIGRDINNQELLSRMKAAGAAKVNIKTPIDTKITPTQIACCGNTKIEYKGYVEE